MKINFDGGLIETTDKTDVEPPFVVEATGMEFREDSKSIFVAKGRQLVARSGGDEIVGIYYAGYDGGYSALVTQTADGYKFIPIKIGSRIVREADPVQTPYPAGGSEDHVVGTHFANRHYLFNNVQNVTLESESGGLFRPMGMEPTGTVISGHTESGTGQELSASIGITYWITEWDEERGIESLSKSLSTYTVPPGNRSQITLNILKFQTNALATHYNIYRSADGGTYPDGSLVGRILVAESQFIDTVPLATTGLTQYGTVTLAGIVGERDYAPPPLICATTFQDSIVGIPKTNPRVLRFTANGYPESWPRLFEVPLESSIHGEGVYVDEINNALCVLMTESVHRVVRLPRDIDSAYAAGEIATRLTDERGCPSRTGATQVTLPGHGVVLAFVSNDGVYMTNNQDVVRILAGVDWDSRVEKLGLDKAILQNDSTRKRLVLYYEKKYDDSIGRSFVNDGVMHLDYSTGKFRVSIPDNGQCDFADVGFLNSEKVVFTGRRGTALIYAESVTNLREDGEITSFSFSPPVLMLAGAANTFYVEDFYIMHGPALSDGEIVIYADGDDHPEVITSDMSSRGKTKITVGRSLNSLQIKIQGERGSTDDTDIEFIWCDLNANLNDTAQASEGL